MFRVSWTGKKTNVEILNPANSRRKILSKVRRRQEECLGRVKVRTRSYNRKSEQENAEVIKEMHDGV